ncbi:MAG: hypothetical protein J0M22_11525 [Gammaproteobacteria bacterium]|jgi:hypothetical protein|nr:hypothetical protein [Gammaproteobacteria bacterium]
MANSQSSNELILKLVDKTWVQCLVLLTFIAVFALIIVGVEHFVWRTLLACGMGLLLLVGYEHFRPLDGNERQLIQLQARQYGQPHAIQYSYRWRVSREFGRLIQH